MTSYKIASGTVPGRTHVEAQRNNQDASYISVSEGLIIAMVADGCSSSVRSEVGANIGLELVGSAIRKNLSGESKTQSLFFHPDKVLERVRQDSLAMIRTLALSMGDNLLKKIEDYFLFTIVGAIIVDWGAIVFNQGDGVVMIDDEWVQFGPFANNAPPYFAYAITGSSVFDAYPELERFQSRQILGADFSSLLLGTDGAIELRERATHKLPGKDEVVGEISQFFLNDLYFCNQDAVRRRLALINKTAIRLTDGRLVKHPGLLGDDTTIVVIQKSEVD